MNIKVDKVATIIELNNYTCRWPLWPNGAKVGVEAPYCGRTKDREQPYCKCHMKLARRGKDNE